MGSMVWYASIIQSAHNDVIRTQVKLHQPGEQATQASQHLTGQPPLGGRRPCAEPGQQLGVEQPHRPAADDEAPEPPHDWVRMRHKTAAVSLPPAAGGEGLRGEEQGAEEVLRREAWVAGGVEGDALEAVAEGGPAGVQGFAGQRHTQGLLWGWAIRGVDQRVRDVACVFMDDGWWLLAVTARTSG